MGRKNRIKQTIIFICVLQEHGHRLDRHPVNSPLQGRPPFPVSPLRHRPTHHHKVSLPMLHQGTSGLHHPARHRHLVDSPHRLYP